MLWFSLVTLEGSGLSKVEANELSESEETGEEAPPLLDGILAPRRLEGNPAVVLVILEGRGLSSWWVTNFSESEETWGKGFADDGGLGSGSPIRKWEGAIGDGSNFLPFE
jgi:hypothetical protein